MISSLFCLSHEGTQMHMHGLLHMLPTVSQYSTDLQVAVKHQEIWKCTNKDRDVEGFLFLSLAGAIKSLVSI